MDKQDLDRHIKQMSQDCVTKWINREPVLEHWLDNSSSILTLTETMAALHSLSKGFTMVTAEHEET